MTTDIAPQIAAKVAARRAAERTAALADYWPAVDAAASGTAPQDLEHLERVLSALELQPTDFDGNAASLRYVRHVRTIDIAAAQAGVAAAEQSEQEAAADIVRAKAALVSREQAHAAAKQGVHDARRRRDAALAELQRGDAARNELLARGAPLGLVGEPLGEPVAPRPMRRFRAMQTGPLAGVHRVKGDLFDALGPFPAELALEVVGAAVADVGVPVRFLCDHEARSLGWNRVERFYHAGTVTRLHGDLSRYPPGTFEIISLDEEARELERQRDEQHLQHAPLLQTPEAASAPQEVQP